MINAIKWRGFVLTPDSESVYADVYSARFADIFVSVARYRVGWIAGVGDERQHEGATPEEALDRAALATIGKSEVEVRRLTELARRIREVVG